MVAKEQAPATVVAFDLSSIPARTHVAKAPSVSNETCQTYVDLIAAGQGGGDGQTYETAKLARNRANTIKRALEKYAPSVSVTTRIWESATGSFVFAILPKPIESTDEAPAA